MRNKSRRNMIPRNIRRILGVILVVAGLSITWAWGQVARLAEPAPLAAEAPPVALYAAWLPDGAERAGLFRSGDEGATWQALPLPLEAAPVTWADNGSAHVAVVMDDGSLLLSEDQGENWIIVESGLEILSLAWGAAGELYLGTEGQGVYQLATAETLVAASMMPDQADPGPIVSLSLVGSRLFAATPAAILYTDDTDGAAGTGAWTQTTSLPDQVTSMVATDERTIYAGVATTGLYKSTDAGRTWLPAWEGLGLAAGQMVRTTALRADPTEPGVLYVAADHLLGSSQVHASAAGLFVTVDGGALWQPLAGPAFPEAQHALGLVLVPGQPLRAQVVTAGGLQAHAPDLAQMLTTLESDNPQARAAAARQLGLAGAQGTWEQLLAALDDPDPAVSWAAADALGRIKDPAAVPGLLVAVEHPSQQIRLGAARALGMMQVQAAVDPLRAMLFQGEGPEVTIAGQALGRIGGPSATGVLLGALASPGLAPSGEDRGSSTSTLPSGARWHVAMAALEGMGEPAVAPLVAMLDSQDAHSRRSAAQLLGWIGSPSAAEALVHALKTDDDAAVRGQAAWALGEIGDPSAHRALERAQLRDPAAEVQIAAGRALARVPAQSAVAFNWAAQMAPTFNRLQPVRWLVLGLSLAGAVWLVVGTGSLATVPLRLRHQ